MCALAAAALAAGSSGQVATGAPAAEPGQPLVSPAGVAEARAFAAGRKGTVAFAVLDPRGRMRGINRKVQFPSASVVKAMLLVAALRASGSEPVAPAAGERLRKMVVSSDNEAARELYKQVGAEGLRVVAAAARMQRFEDVGDLFEARITAADQARFFLRIDRIVPAAHRALTRTLLASIVPSQRWGIAPAAERLGIRVLFKGGWRKGITHQVALLERGGRRVALAILTSGAPSQAYGRRTLEGIARRVLR